MDDDRPISYLALAVGTPVPSSSGTPFGTVEHVLQVPELDLLTRSSWPRITDMSCDLSTGSRSPRRCAAQFRMTM